MFQRSLFGPALRAETYRQAYRALGSGSGPGRPIHTFSHIQQNARAFSGLNKKPITDIHLRSSVLGNVAFPYALGFKSFIHSGKQAEYDAGRTAPGFMDYAQGLPREKGNDVNGRPPRYNPPTSSINYVQGLFHEKGNDMNRRPPLYNPQVESFQGMRESGNILNGRTPLHQTQLESNADIVHIKLLRNNAFVTVTDSKGDKKIGVSAGQLAGKGGKLTRYSGEAAAENIGRKVRQMKTKSVVVKVNGLTYFRRKKDAILSFKDGYSNSRGDMNPVVYLEDTTRKPHNGCRLPKKRRI
ncbi:hypothetical protein OROGR_026944 [Orobanche gracilis]